jgi:hypothetical protein
MLNAQGVARHGHKDKKEKTRRKEGEPPDLLQRRKDVSVFPVIMIT